MLCGIETDKYIYRFIYLHPTNHAIIKLASISIVDCLLQCKLSQSGFQFFWRRLLVRLKMRQNDMLHSLGIFNDFDFYIIGYINPLFFKYASGRVYEFLLHLRIGVELQKQLTESLTEDQKRAAKRAGATVTRLLKTADGSG